MELFRTVGYDKWFSVHPDVDVLFKDSGHILGSASVHLKIRRAGLKDLMLGFTADIGRPNRPILRDPDPMLPCDILISESTYGDRLHPSQPQEESKLLQIIVESCIERKGKLIIPAFSVGRTQEIVYMLDQLYTKHQLPEIPIYVDSPLAVNATTVFQAHPECYDKEILDYMLTDPNPFGFNSLKYTRTADESKALNMLSKCVIISASGMINAGRVKHHVFNAIEHAENTILLVGYSAENTPGGKLRRGDTSITLFGKVLQVNARIEKMESFSAHGDYKEMIDYFRSQQKDKLRNIFLVHGDKPASLAFKSHLEDEHFMQVNIPSLGQEVDI
jgi:metallo-beta-lactamase family protein